MWAIPKTSLQHFVKKMRRHPIVVGFVILLSVLTALSQFIDSIQSIVDTAAKFFISQESDPRIFHFAGQTIHLEGGVGASLQNAVIIRGALTTDAGIAAEEHWAETFYPYHKKIQQALTSSNLYPGRMFDEIVLRPNYQGSNQVLYFDVTEFLGSPGSNADEQRAMEIALHHCEETNAGKREYNCLLPTGPVQIVITDNLPEVTENRQAGRQR